MTQAETYLATAEIVAGKSGDEWCTVAAGDAVLAGIAASDAICCVRLGKRSRSADHRQAVEMLKNATPDGGRLAEDLDKLLGLKDQSHYGATMVTTKAASLAIRWAKLLVDRGREELEK